MINQTYQNHFSKHHMLENQFSEKIFQRNKFFLWTKWALGVISLLPLCAAIMWTLTLTKGNGRRNYTLQIISTSKLPYFFVFSPIHLLFPPTFNWFEESNCTNELWWLHLSLTSFEKNRHICRKTRNLHAFIFSVGAAGNFSFFGHGGNRRS